MAIKKSPNLLILGVDFTVREPTGKSTYVESTDGQILMDGVKERIAQYDLNEWAIVGVSNKAGVTAVNPETRKPYLTLTQCWEQMKYLKSKLLPELSVVYFCTVYDGKFCYRSSLGAIASEDNHKGLYRMPKPGMIFAAIERYWLIRGEQIVFVGDDDANKKAADAARKEYPRIKFEWVEDWLSEG